MRCSTEDRACARRTWCKLFRFACHSIIRFDGRCCFRCTLAQRRCRAVARVCRERTGALAVGMPDAPRASLCRSSACRERRQARTWESKHATQLRWFRHLDMHAGVALLFVYLIFPILAGGGHIPSTGTESGKQKSVDFSPHFRPARSHCTGNDAARSDRSTDLANGTHQ